MKLSKCFEKWGMTGLKLKLGILETEWKPQEQDREAAWELYVEMLTRIVTQPLPAEQGDEKTALESVHKLFEITREILRRKGRECVQFTKVAIVVLNQIVRPFTAKWHSRSIQGGFKTKKDRREFRAELVDLQTSLKQFSRALADIAQVEDLTAFAQDEDSTKGGSRKKKGSV